MTRIFKSSPIFFAAVLSLFLTYQPASTFAQNQDCDPALFVQINDSLRNDSVDIKVQVSSDIIKLRKFAACVEIKTAGLYRIFAGIDYSGPQDGQTEESFFLQIITSNEDTIAAIDFNAGIYKVVKDDNTITGFPETDIDAGLYSLTEGIYNIYLNHYKLIASEYPDFINNEDRKIPNGPHSVDLMRLILVFDAEECDLRLTKKALPDRVSTGDTISYTLKLKNEGPDTATAITLQDMLADSTILDTESISPPPLQINDRKITWDIDKLAPDSSLVFSYRVKVIQIQSSPLLVNRSEVSSACGGDSAMAVVEVVPDSTDLELTKSVPPVMPSCTHSQYEI